MGRRHLRSQPVELAGPSRTTKYAVYGPEIELPDAGTMFLSYVEACGATGEGWNIASGPREMIRLCPTSCDALKTGVYAAVRIFRACPSIVCPPP